MHQNKFKAMLILIGLVMAGVAAIRPPGPYRNLKVLPQDITEKKLDSIMRRYNKALGVACEFCHHQVGNQIDFESDKNSMKDNAREMIHLMIDINKLYFNYDTLKHPAYLNTVACYTCHRGEVMPPDNNKLPAENNNNNKKPLFPFGNK